MKITFDDKSYVECHKSDTPNKILLIVSALDPNNKLKRIMNAVELTTEEFKQLISEVQ
jgi:hypothetical protein